MTGQQPKTDLSGMTGDRPAEVAALIERFGPGRQLDRLIEEATAEGVTRHPYENSVKEGYVIKGPQAYLPPHYTESVDDALKLVPEDFRLELKGVNDSWLAALNDTRHIARSADVDVIAVTAALAICIAALLLRQAISDLGSPVVQSTE